MNSEAWKTLRLSLVNFHGAPVGTIAALDSTDEKLNFDQTTLLLQSWEKIIDRFRPSAGVMLVVRSSKQYCVSACIITGKEIGVTEQGIQDGIDGKKLKQLSQPAQT
ncbi:hypothetical protein KIW84_035083 [Lathyrus oleraceus]|uniref:Uncharacterized protein n=1 Tax=Pisum sativum TaxID=3888 RepID=A0A9D5B5I9_PEA|nr:hypothetical protein KIW84_035083 [Pisum sativum]